MTSKGGAHPITMKDLEAHYPKVDEKMKTIIRGETDIVSYFDVIKGIGNAPAGMSPPEVYATTETLRQGFGLFYHLHGILEDQLKDFKAPVPIPPSEERVFKNSYSLFGASSYIAKNLEKIVAEKEAIESELKSLATLDATKDNVLSYVMLRLYGILNTAKRNDNLKEPVDVARQSIGLFKHLRDQCVEKKPTLHKELLELVEGTEFRVGDNMTISGFEAGSDEKSKAHQKTSVLVPVLPYQVAGNVIAKRNMLRDMDRMALFDLEAQRNPAIDVGGLSWSVLYDGLPGTGKSSLFKMGMTRLNQRLEQINEFRKLQNLPPIGWKQLTIDQGIKDEYYGKTGKNLIATLDEAKRTDGIYIVIADDIDLLVSGTRNDATGGSDKDIMNILMQYVDGVNTKVIGNSQLWAATNDPVNLDPALRQRFIARYPVDGPIKWYDFADILNDKLGREIKAGIVKVDLGDYKPYEARKNETGFEEDKATMKAGKSMTLKELGMRAAEMKQEQERFTGRAMNAVAEAIKKRANDYDIPEEWYANPETFFGKDYTTRVGMLRELSQKVDASTILSEMERYFGTEGRYAADKFETDVQRAVHQGKVIRAATEKLRGEEKNGP